MPYVIVVELTKSEGDQLGIPLTLECALSGLYLPVIMVFMHSELEPNRKEPLR